MGAIELSQRSKPAEETSLSASLEYTWTNKARYLRAKEKYNRVPRESLAAIVCVPSPILCREPAVVYRPANRRKKIHCMKKSDERMKVTNRRGVIDTRCTRCTRDPNYL